MILLFDTYNDDSFSLHVSVLSTGTECTAVSVLDDGFLPEDVRSPYMECIGQREEKSPEPLYFDKVKVPRLWEIRDVGGKSEIWDSSVLKGRIIYAEPKHKRFVSSVEWLDREGNVRLREHYNQWGRLFAKSYMDAGKRIAIKQYYDRNGKPMLTENLVTGAILAVLDGKEHSFSSRAEFVADYLYRNGWEYENILYNSLSTPFFVSNLLKKRGAEGNDALYWNEEIRGAIPGNMKAIINDRNSKTKKIFVGNDSSIRALRKEGVDPRLYRMLGYVHPFIRENGKRPEVLIMTNSDRVEKIREIVAALPQLRFHIAAVTMMSEKLLSLSSFPNVCLYPNVKYDVADRLFEDCDIYLDINRGNEILNSVQKAFYNNMLIFAFKETVHRPECVSPENMFSLAAFEELIGALSEAANESAEVGADSGSSILAQRLESQKKYAHAETPEEYQKALMQAGLIPADPVLTEKWRIEETAERKTGEQPHVFFAMHDKTGKYAREVGAAMRSVIWSSSRKVCFHIVHDDSLTLDNREKLTQIAVGDGHEIVFHNCELESIDSTVNTYHYTIGSLYRLLIPDMVPQLDKGIYLDVDMLVNRDICELWDTDLGEYAMAAVREPGVQRVYYNSGMLFMNLKILREDEKKYGRSLLERCVDVIQKNNFSFPDQDAINILYANRILPMDDVWNTFTGREITSDRKAENCIYHYGASFINLMQPNEVDQKMIRAYAETPWGEELLREKYDQVGGRQNDLLMVLGKMLNQVSGVQRTSDKMIRKIYFDIRTSKQYKAEERFEKCFLKQYPPMPGDFHVESVPSGMQSADGIPVYSVDQLLDLIKDEKKGDYVILIRPTKGYFELRDSLIQKGLVENQDFFNALRLLQRREGGYA